MVHVWSWLGVGIALLAIEWPWHRWSLQALAAIVRVLVVLAVGLWLSMDLGASLTAGYRNALTTSDRVTSIGGRVVTPYQSGVFTMEREATHGLKGITAPLLVLLWLGAVPGIRAFGIAFRTAPKPAGTNHVGDPSQDAA